MHPTQYPESWNKAVKYIQAKDKRLTFNAEFRPLFKAVKQEMREEGCHEKVLSSRAKAKVLEILKTKAALKTAAEQSGAGQDEVQP